MSELDQLFHAAWNTLTQPGAPFAWSEQDVNGHPVRVYDESPPNLRLLWDSTVAHGNADYIVYEDERITYAEAHTTVQALAAHLAAQGIGKGDHVAIAMRNYPEWILAYWAIVSMGAVVVGMNAWWVTAEMKYGLDDAKPKAIVCDAERLANLLPVLADVRAAHPLHVIAVRADTTLPENATSWADATATPADDLAAVDLAPDDPACIFYTSGTTGFPKGAVLTHRSCIANVMNLGFAAALLEVAGNLAAQAAGTEPPAAPENPPQPAGLAATPLFHVTANNCGLHPMTAAGGKVLLMYKWDAVKALELIETEGVSSISCVPIMARELVEHPEFHKYDTSTLGSLGGGGAAVQPDLVEKIDRTQTVTPSTGYGLTETSGVISVVGGPWFVAKPQSCGPALPVIEAKVVGPDGNSLPTGEIGELWVRGPNNVDGYLNKPEATAEAFTDGYFHTGDLAYLDDDDYITIADRAKDMVLRGGENIYCAEVEAVLFDHPAVKECAVFAIPDDRLGEVPGAAIVCKDGIRCSADELKAHAGERMAKHKIPEQIWILEEDLPRNASGKFLKRQLKEDLLG